MLDLIREILIENWHGSYNDCADDLYEILDNKISFLHEFVNKFSDTEIPIDAIKEALNEYYKNKLK